jgi:WD40 repeat protein
MNLKKKDFLAGRKAVAMNSTSKIIKASAMSKEGDLAITGDESGQVNLWNLLSAELIVTIIEPVSKLESKGISKLALSNSRLFSLIAFMDGMVSVYDNEMGDIVAIFVEHQHPVKHLYVFEDNLRIMSSDGNNSCKIWYSHSGELLESITVACDVLGHSPDMKYCISGPGKNTLENFKKRFF